MRSLPVSNPGSVCREIRLSNSRLHFVRSAFWVSASSTVGLADYLFQATADRRRRTWCALGEVPIILTGGWWVVWLTPRPSVLRQPPETCDQAPAGETAPAPFQRRRGLP